MEARLFTTEVLALLETDMMTPLDSRAVEAIISQTPFIHIEGVCNFRDLGLLSSSPIPSGLIYRSGGIHSIAPSDLSALGIKLVIDLRSERERQAQPSPTIPGIEIVHVSTTAVSEPTSLQTYQSYEFHSVVHSYMKILSTHAPVIEMALKHILTTRGRSPFLIHCTAGKDRTGVLSAILLCLASADLDTIVYDYMLSRVGVEGQRDQLEAMVRIWGREDEGFAEGVKGRSVAERDGLTEAGKEEWKDKVQVRQGFITGFLAEVESRWGSVEGWVSKKLGWNEEDIRVLKQFLKG